MRLEEMCIKFEVKKPCEEYFLKVDVVTESAIEGEGGYFWWEGHRDVVSQGDDLSAMSFDAALDILLSHVGESLKVVIREAEQAEKAGVV